MKYFDHSMTQPGLVPQLVERRCSNPEVVSSDPAGEKDFTFILVLISNFFFKACGRGEIMEGSIAHFLALIHTLYIIITKFIAIVSSWQLSN